ncbi:UDP-glucose 4-epimerase [bioreactor metagenome]|uniref:UDP-glucose 4-epimerase n=1 Tax=bioreactor metagenome TaxID=1076179 RepID=A0A644WBK2_9ZZZZ
MKILITGGTGYIGSHTAVELLTAGYEVVIVDNLTNSKREVIDRIRQITSKNVLFFEDDLLNAEKLEEIFTAHTFVGVIHFAGLKAVGESTRMPLQYYHNNLTGTLNLLRLMDKYHVKKMIFSSSATVYGMENTPPFAEDMPLSATNPYGRTKLMIEQILRDVYASDSS